MGIHEKIRAVFSEEQESLLSARQEMQADKHRYNELLPGYEKLSSRYEKILREMNKVLHISDKMSLAMIRMETEIKTLLDNAGQGFLMIDSSLKVQKQYSAECARIFGRKIGGLPFAMLVWPDEPDARAYLELQLLQLLEPSREKRPERISTELPAMIERDGMRIRIEYKRIDMPGVIEEPRIMIIMTDETEQHQSREMLEFLSTHDPLTGMYNRNYLDLWVDKEYRQTSGVPLSVVMADMNGLKLVNDVFGHRSGDGLLIRASELILRIFREEAVCIRWGGDEFLILLPDTDAEACQSKVRHLMEAFEDSEPSPIKISMAVGTATLTHPEERFSELFVRAEKEMYKRKLIESRNVRRQLIEDISGKMYASGIEDPAHIARVTDMALGLAERMDIPRYSSQTELLQKLAALHDVGKIAIPKDILLNAGELTPYQREIVQTHSEIGYRLVFSLGEPALAESILSLHERWDGNGYPHGIMKDQIPEPARLFAVVDAYDVMTHDQPYRNALSREEAISRIKDGSGSQFDPVIAEKFVGWLEERQLPPGG
ncbi:diguanylate cyclase domain-containing protein [Cohnella suwonensis]|uniref:Diguanylate cyclase domain-containing protein n=1 Tax=Cohnella suwonensis TaxID=696072 RepID=A0ABW0M156_9BACL